MSKQLIKDIKDGDFVSSFFQIEGGQLNEFKSKSGKFAVLNLSDRTGTLRAVCWENGEKVYHSLEVGGIAYVQGRVNVFNNNLQINVDKIHMDEHREYDPADFLPVGEVDVEARFAYIGKLMDSVQNPYLNRLLHAFFDDPEIAAPFKECPAAKSIHHNYIGGLIEHITNCARIAETLCEIYPRLNRDLLITGTLLHDIGKIRELSFDTKIDYTDEGRLTGHLVIGERMIWERIRNIEGFPAHLENEILHLILSHHGENNTGSPKRPKMAEACALHFLENLDAQTKRFLQIIEGTNSPGKSAWTTYDRLLERYVYKGYPDDDEPGNGE